VEGRLRRQCLGGGQHILCQYKPVTIAGIAPESFYGDRLSSTPPDLYLPVEAMPALANAP
jgi:hypothetical protein